MPLWTITRANGGPLRAEKGAEAVVAAARGEYAVAEQNSRRRSPLLPGYRITPRECGE